MQQLNLIPLPRRRLKRSRRHLGVSAAICAAFLALSAAYVGAAAMLVDSNPSLNDDLAEARASIERGGKKLSALTAEASAARSRLLAATVIREQPDWSMLLALLGEKTGDDVVLRACRVKPIDAAPAKTAPGKAPAKPVAAALESKFIVELGGLGRNQMAVSHFVLRLEQSGLFDRVTLMDTNREAFLSGEASGFRVECALSGSVPTAADMDALQRFKRPAPTGTADASEGP